jgi:hypothetical protein
MPSVSAVVSKAASIANGGTKLTKALAVLMAGSLTIGLGGFYAPQQVGDEVDSKVAGSIAIDNVNNASIQDWMSENQGEAFGGELDPKTNKQHFYLFNITNLNQVSL